MGALGLKAGGAAAFGLKCCELQTLNRWQTHGFSYDAAAEELTRFANQVV